MIVHALRSLLTRYREAFSEAWSARRGMDAERRTAEELEFLPAALSLRDTPVSYTHLTLPTTPYV